MALSQSLEGRGCWPRAGAEARGQDQASCAGSPCDLQDCWAAIQHPQVSPEPEVKVSLATRTLPLPGCREATEAETGQTARLPALSPFSEMARLKNAFVGSGWDGAAWGGWGRRGSVSVNQSPPGETEFPNPEWEKGDALNLFTAPVAWA